MAQTTFNSDLNALTEGQIVSDRFNSKIISGEVNDSNGIALGRFMGANNTAQTLFQNLYSDTAVSVLSGDLVTSNSVAVTLNINGVSNVLTATVFSSDHDTTMGLIEAKLEALTGVASATVSDANNRTMTVLADVGYDIYFEDFTVTLGAGQATATLSNTCSSVILGPSVQEELAPDSSGNVTFANTEAVGAMRKGNIAVQCDGTINPSGSVFVRFFEESASNKKRGMLSTAAGSSPTKAIALTGTYKVEQAMSSSALGVIALNNA